MHLEQFPCLFRRFIFEVNVSGVDEDDMNVQDHDFDTLFLFTIKIQPSSSTQNLKVRT